MELIKKTIYRKITSAKKRWSMTFITPTAFLSKNLLLNFITNIKKLRLTLSHYPNQWTECGQHNPLPPGIHCSSPRGQAGSLGDRSEGQRKTE